MRIAHLKNGFLVVLMEDLGHHHVLLGPPELLALELDLCPVVRRHMDLHSAHR